MDDKTKLWIKAAVVRALKTVAQSAVAAIGTSVAMSDVNWTSVVSISVCSGILSLLTSVAGLPEVDYAVSLVNTDDNGNTDRGTDKEGQA